MRDKQKGKHWNNTKEITGKIKLENKLEQYLETLCLYQWEKAGKQANKQKASKQYINSGQSGQENQKATRDRVGR